MECVKFTIATVTYNAGATIRRTLLSVAEQTYAGVEHIIVDGCSTDGTMEEVQRYVEGNCDGGHGHVITLVREPDSGIYDAMNKALQMARGDYIVFLNAGDKLHSRTTLEEVARCIGQAPPRLSPVGRGVKLTRKDWGGLPGVVYGETDIVDDDGRFLHRRHHAAPERLTSGSFLRGMLVCHQSFYVRADLARQTPYDLRWRLSGDYDWCIRVMRLAERRQLPMVGTDLVLTDYLSEGMTTRNHRRSLLERLRIMAEHYGWVRALLSHVWLALRHLQAPPPTPPQ